MANTRDVIGEQATLDGLVEDTLTRFEEDGCTSLGNYALQYHNALEEVCFPNVTAVNQYCLADCSSLEVADFGKLANMNSGVFDNTPLKYLILRVSAKNSGGNIMRNMKCPVGYRAGAVFVPDNLVDTYKADSYWSKLIVHPLSLYPTDDISTIRESWDDIITACGNGTYASKYDIGGIKSIDINGTRYYMQLVAKDADVLASDGTTTVPTTWILSPVCYGTKHSMNATKTTVGGWADSGMRSWLANDVFPLLPSNVRTAIKEVRKYSGIYESDVVVKDDITADKLWIPSVQEVNLGTDFETQGPVYSGAFSDIERRLMYDTSYGKTSWPLRSTISSVAFKAVSNGQTGSCSAEINMNLAFGFCI